MPRAGVHAMAQDMVMAGPPVPARVQVDIHRRMRGAHREFTLQVQFTSTAARTVVFGPSGAGKSLTLRALAGLLQPDAGVIRLDGRTLFDSRAGVHLPARQRRVGYLFQDYALFPHLTVQQNVAFGLQAGWRNPPVAGRDERVERWLAAFRLGPVARQYPAEISGGQRQRTALARALVNSPAALLLDEPFAALDTELREHMRAELDALLRELGIPIVLITHDPQDLERFGECVVRLSEGRVAAQPGPPPARPLGALP